MAALTAATTQRENLGSLTLIIYTFTSVSDADTYATGMGTNIFSFQIQTNGNPVTQASAGNGATVDSSGIFTFYPGENSLPLILWVLARV